MGVTSREEGPRRRGGVSGEPRLTRECVLDCAGKLFAEHGYRATNLAHVAARLGVTRQALYYYFARKHDILLALFDRMMGRFERGADEVDDRGLDAGARYAALLEMHGRLVAENVDLVTILLGENAEFPEASWPLVQGRRRAYTQRLVEAYAEGVSAGALRPADPALAVNTMIGAMNCMFRWYRPDKGLRPVEVAGAMTRLMLQGCDLTDR